MNYENNINKRFYDKLEISNAELKVLLNITLNDLNIYKNKQKEYYEIPIEEFISLDSENFPYELFTKINSNKNALKYFNCLFMLHKKRRKFHYILNFQETPSITQVAIRGILEYQEYKEQNLKDNLIKRKRTYDIDNRSAQETGYLIESIFREALNGAYSSQINGDVTRTNNPEKFRQVDCIIEKDGFCYAYEIKLRLSMAASGQGRFNEELNFAEDCKNSNFIPVLLILEDTDNTKFLKIKKNYEINGGLVFTGENAWEHIIKMSPLEISLFIEKYLYKPLKNISK